MDAPTPTVVNHLLPDDVLLVGNVGPLPEARPIMDNVRAVYPERRVIFFAGDIAVELLREVESDA